MRNIVHISDLHFGKINQSLLEPLVDFIKSIKPDLVVISGDITTRARKKEFIGAKAFLDSLPFPKIVVPGNHDIPLYNMYSRFFQTMRRYKRYVTNDLEPMYRDDHMLVFGLNTARSSTLVRGRVDISQIEKVCAEFDKLPPDVLRMVVTHHPFDLPEEYSAHNLQRKPDLAMEMLIKSKVDILLAGHTHKSLIDHIPAQAEKLGYGPLVVQSGTSTSIRTRRETNNNSLNVITLDYPKMQIRNYFWDKQKKIFFQKVIKEFAHGEKGWKS